MCLTAKFRKKPQRCLNLGPKMSYLGVFGPDFSKNYCHIRNQPASNLSNMILQKKKKICLNLGPKIPYLGLFELEFLKSIVIFEISTLEFA